MNVIKSFLHYGFSLCVVAFLPLKITYYCLILLDVGVIEERLCERIQATQIARFQFLMLISPALFICLFLPKVEGSKNINTFEGSS